MNVIGDTQRHIALVAYYLESVAEQLQHRADRHDRSKLESPEREMYEVWRPKLDTMSIESAEYKEALKQMGEGLKHHYENNRHHPEHFENGIAEMTLIDVVEMVCDWKAAAARKNETVNMEWASKRFNIPPDSQLYRIIENTIADIS